MKISWLTPNKPEDIQVVLDFTPIYLAWLNGKCTTNYLLKFCNEQVYELFVTNLLKGKR